MPKTDHKIISLKDFISQTLTQLVEGIKDAQGNVEDLGGSVNPKGSLHLSGSSATIQHKETSRMGSEVEFELAVTGSDTAKGDGKLGIWVLAGSISKSLETGYVNKIRFSVPVIFPKGEYSESQDNDQFVASVDSKIQANQQSDANPGCDGDNGHGIENPVSLKLNELEISPTKAAKYLSEKSGMRISQPRIHMHCKGERRIGHESMDLYNRYLGISADEMFEWNRHLRDSS